MEKTLTDVNLTIYDYYQISSKEICDNARHEFAALPKEDRHRISIEHKKEMNKKPKRYFNGKTKITD